MRFITQRSKHRVLRGSTVCAAALAFVFFAPPGFAQSTFQDHPTPVTSNEIAGEIPARAIGDARSTTHYFAFDGTQGDIFINIVTSNLNGVIDIFTRDGLRPMTKVIVFADTEESETGRVIYLRRSEQLLLRVQGRTPDDDPANYRIKFAGSFAALPADAFGEQPEIPRVPERADETVAAAPAEDQAEEPERAEPIVAESAAVAEEQVAEEALTAVPPAERADRPRRSYEVRIKDPLKELGKVSDDRKTPGTGETAARDRTAQTRSVAERRSDDETEDAEDAQAAAAEEEDPAKAEPEEAEAEFQLVIEFRNGSKIERPMSEVSRFSIDRGTLTVIDKSGRVGRYSMAEVRRVGIQ